MRVLWIAVVLALFQCNTGQEESSTVSDDLIQSVFNGNDTTFEDKYGAETTTVDQGLIDTLFNTNDLASEKGTETETETGTGTGTGTAEDPDEPSKTPNPCKVGECVPFFRCMNGSIITNGDGILDLRFGDDEEERPCPDFYETCCSLVSPTIVISPTIVETEHKPTLGKPEKCGVRNKNGAVFKVTDHDNEAQFAEFPWVVAIIYKVRDNDAVESVYKCAGSLIHPRVVMTVAHCMVNLTEVHDILIRAGEWDTQTIKEPFPHQDRAVVEVLVHEHYTRGSHINDVALLFLDKPVALAENVNTACLPPQDFNFDHQRCFANGWGKNKFGKDGINLVILKRIELPIVPHSECQTQLRGTRLGKHFQLHPSFMCAGGEPGKDVCEGDGGAPLNCEIPNNKHGQYYVAGEVAWGIGCFDAVPGVYANVAKLRHWVDNIFEQRNIEQKYYIA